MKLIMTRLHNLDTLHISALYPIPMYKTQILLLTRRVLVIYTYAILRYTDDNNDCTKTI